jgi:Zn-dependent protease/CBS domain-containing protein
MHHGFRIGRIAGITIEVDWSWIFIFLLVTWDLAIAVFPQIHPDWSVGLSWITALIASLLFFAAVLAHEFAHSLTAKRFGLPIRRITLFLFGGVSNLEREPQSARAEFIIAVVGPLTSFALGILFLFLARLHIGSVPLSLGKELGQLDPISTLLLWLGPINILVALFNLVPGFPLDGGRILRAAIWGATGDFIRATRWAAGAGRMFAWILMAAGLAMIFGISVPFFGRGLIGGLWLIFIGWFLSNAATQSFQQVLAEDLLEGVPVSRLMRSEVPTVDPYTSISDFVYHHLIGTDERAFPVMEGGRLIGLVCLEDVRKTPREDWDRKSVRDIMTPAERLATVAPTEDVTRALSQLARNDIRQLPVVESGRLVGMLRRRDIVRWLQINSKFAASH